MDSTQQSNDNLMNRQNFVNNVLHRTTNTESIKARIHCINFLTEILNDKTFLLDSREFFEYYSALTNLAIDEPLIQAIDASLSALWFRFCDVCYEWRDLSESFPTDYNWRNSICVALTLTLDALKRPRGIPVDNEITNRCVPRMLTAMIVMMSTFYTIKEVMIIMRPIGDYLKDYINSRRTANLAISDDWKQVANEIAFISEMIPQFYYIDKSTDDSVLCKVIISCVDLALDFNKFRAHISCKIIAEISKETEIPFEQLFIRFQFEISHHLLRIIELSPVFDIQLLYDSMRVFQITTLPKELLKYIVPPFAVNDSGKTRLVLSEIAKILDGNIANVVKPYINEIMCEFFYDKRFKNDVNNIAKLIEFLSSFTKMDIAYCVRYNLSEIRSAFLFRISKDYKSSLEALAFVNHCELKEKNIANFKLSLFLDNEKSLKSWLKPHFLSYIHKLDAFIINRSVITNDKIAAIESFAIIMKIMDKQLVTPFRIKIFATIKLIINQSQNFNCRKLSIDVLLQFVKLVDDDTYMSRQLLAISALILPFMHFVPNETSQLFNELIIQKRTNIKFRSYFKHLYFIPQMNELKEVNDVLNVEIAKAIDTDNEFEAICLVMSNINHENSLVQVYALRQLLKHLEESRQLIYRSCFDGSRNGSELLVSEIIMKLMSCISSSQNEVRLLVTECLGVIGAIDPSIIDLDKPIISKQELQLLIDETHFLRSLAIQLMSAVNNAQLTCDQDCASYALQEILKQPGYRKKIEDNAPQDVFNYCKLLNYSKYQTASITQIDDLPDEPIFVPNLAFDQWLFDWTSSLYHRFILCETKNSVPSDGGSTTAGSGSQSSASQQFDDDFENALNKNYFKSNVLIFCYHSVIRNQSLAQFLLPFIVICSLRNADKNKREIIVKEIKSIISQLTTDEKTFSSDIGHQSSQTVFNLYDHLKYFLKKRKHLHKVVAKTPRHIRMAFVRDREAQGVNYFLQSISTKDLATLAYNCRAYSRSLRYLEEHVKQKNIFQEEIPFLQKIFLNLNDTDSIEGCNYKRTKAASIRETILTHEASGQIQEALICCAKGIQVYPNEFEFQNKYIRTSMNALDQTKLVYNYGIGLMMKQPEWRRKLAPYVMEAAWKLGEWHELERLLDEHKHCAFSTFESGLGGLLNSIRNKQYSSECEDKLRALRQQLIEPLSAAAMEVSGYLRAHHSIVNLHILSDVQLVLDNFFPELSDECLSLKSVENNFLKITRIWGERSNMVRNSNNCLESILNVQRAILSLIDKECDFLSLHIRKEFFKSWLKSTKTSRKVGNIQRSYNCLLEMHNSYDTLITQCVGLDMELVLSKLERSEAIRETAKVYWNRNDKTRAIYYLGNEIFDNFRHYQVDYYCKVIRGEDHENFTDEDKKEITQSLAIDFPLTPSTPISSLSSSNSSNASQSCDDSKAFAKLQLLLTKYYDQTDSMNHQSLSIMYKSVTLADPHCEQSHYCLAIYYNKLLKIFEESHRTKPIYPMAKPEEMIRLKGLVVKSLSDSLKYGVKHVDVSLPLLLDIWFELGSELHQFNKRALNSNLNVVKARTFEKVMAYIDSLTKNIPSYVFFTVFTQLTSRMLHPNATVSNLLKRIIAKIIGDYPNQSMWLFVRCLNSNNMFRRNYSGDIMKLVEQNRNLSQFNNDFDRLVAALKEFCVNKNEVNNNKQSKQLSLAKHFPKLSQLYSPSSNFSQILLPFHSLINVVLPHSVHSDHNPFPTKQVYIHKFDDNVEVLTSLQRPKKLTILGSDGKKYLMLCKDNDDLRKDGALINCCNLLNRCFRRDTETRKRQIKVKTYVVIPLSDTSGLIEWVPGLLPYRTIVEHLYKVSGEYDQRNVSHVFPDKSLPKDRRINGFREVILPKFDPPIFAQWFISSFSDPLSWFAARTLYTRSTAIFSIIGYIFGLGDRHGENIMIDETSGETVHVDFNVLFNKGEDFNVPERVPFRLTQNMVNAMGPTGFEGVFRKTCEHALRVMRDNRNAFLSLVTPFRYDHLLEWYQRGANFTQMECKFEQAEKIVYNIEARLSGIPSRNSNNLPKGIPLSVEGQVDHIIKEAIDIKNLGVMYIGWAAWL